MAEEIEKLKKELEDAQEEVDEARTRGSAQRIQLLDEVSQSLSLEQIRTVALLMLAWLMLKLAPAQLAASGECRSEETDPPAKVRRGDEAKYTASRSRYTSKGERLRHGVPDRGTVQFQTTVANTCRYLAHNDCIQS